MTKSLTYPVPVGEVCVEQEIKRSRFIASVGRSRGAEKAVRFIEGVRAAYPDATHHCWAYVAGPPGNTTEIGASDAGEPRGTAGRPMLSVLQYRGIGEIVAVVTRYFGGTKLGTGGLVRAYSSSVQLALDQLTVEEFVAVLALELTVPYQFESAVRYLIEQLNIHVGDVAYGREAVLVLEVPESSIETLTGRAADLTNGTARVKYRTQLVSG